MDFKDAFKFVIGEEGGYTADPDDAGNWTGGARGKGKLLGTKYGIAANTYGERLAKAGKTIKDLTLDDAMAIYKRDWWDKMRCDELPPLYRLPLFSAAVNCGMARAVKWLQESVDAKPDGALGPKTIAATHATDRGAGVRHFYDYWKAHYFALVMRDPVKKKYLKGWLNRVRRTAEANAAVYNNVETNF